MSEKTDLIVVAGGGGFIGGHLVADLRRQGFTRIRVADIKPTSEWYQLFDDCENLVLDLKDRASCTTATSSRSAPARSCAVAAGASASSSS